MRFLNFIQSPTINILLFLILGWLLGILSPLILNKIKKKYHKEDLKQAIFSELKEIRTHLVILVFLLSEKNGTFCKKLLSWIVPYLEEDKENLLTQNMLPNIEKLEKRGEDELLEAAEYIKLIQSNQDLTLRQFNTHFIDTAISEITVLKLNFQRKLCEIKRDIDILNEEIAEIKWMSKQTFNSSISQINYRIIQSNLKDAYINFEGMVRRTIKKIDNLLKMKS